MIAVSGFRFVFPPPAVLGRRAIEQNGQGGRVWGIESRVSRNWRCSARDSAEIAGSFLLNHAAVRSCKLPGEPERKQHAGADDPRRSSASFLTFLPS
jgi:hypothetical protein